MGLGRPKKVEEIKYIHDRPFSQIREDEEGIVNATVLIILDLFSKKTSYNYSKCCKGGYCYFFQQNQFIISL
jgi:hypothetical protein